MAYTEGINKICEDCLNGCKQFPFVTVIDCKRLVADREQSKKSKKNKKVVS